MNYRLGVYEKSMPGSLSLRQKLRCAREAGFDYMELSIDETDEKLARLNWSDAELDELRRAMRETGLPIHSICLSAQRRFPLGDPDDACRRRALEILRQAVILASRLGIRLIQLAGYDVYYQPGTPETRRLFEQNLKDSVPFAAANGVMLAFETMETPFMDTVSKAMRYVDAVGSPWLQIYPDIGNLTNASLSSGVSVPDDLETGRGHIAAVHLKETVPGVFREVPFGTGHVDFAACVRKALQLGVRAFVGEFWYTGSPAWQADLAAANAFLREKISEAQKA